MYVNIDRQGFSNLYKRMFTLNRNVAEQSLNLKKVNFS